MELVAQVQIPTKTVALWQKDNSYAHIDIKNFLVTVLITVYQISKFLIITSLSMLLKIAVYIRGFLTIFYIITHFHMEIFSVAHLYSKYSKHTKIV